MTSTLTKASPIRGVQVVQVGLHCQLAQVIRFDPMNCRNCVTELITLGKRPVVRATVKEMTLKSMALTWCQDAQAITLRTVTRSTRRITLPMMTHIGLQTMEQRTAHMMDPLTTPMIPPIIKLTIKLIMVRIMIQKTWVMTVLLIQQFMAQITHHMTRILRQDTTQGTTQVTAVAITAFMIPR